jgi:glycosyltransferase involved in cell wall biosynthesis
MRALARRGRWPSDAVVLFAGRERDRATSALCRRLARDPGIAASVRFLGAVKDVRSLYWASDLLLMPSLYEGLANAALEGCAAGLPAILSHAANVDEIVRPGESGWEIPTGRQGALVRALEEALATAETRLGEMGRLATAHVTARFAPRPSHVIDQMVAVYDELLAAGAPA